MVPPIMNHSTMGYIIKIHSMSNIHWSQDEYSRTYHDIIQSIFYKSTEDQHFKKWNVLSNSAIDKCVGKE